MEEELLITFEQKEDKVIVRLQGDITKTSGEKILKCYQGEEGLPNNAKMLLLDFAQVNYINSAGIAYLIRLARSLNHFDIRAFSLSYHYEKMFHIVGLSKFMKFYPSEWAAIEG